MTELLALPYSPWSEKARWALDVRGVPYDYRRYQPVLGELALRVKLRHLARHLRVRRHRGIASDRCRVSARIRPQARSGQSRMLGDPELASKYADLVAWRDALYEKYRPRR
jgi:hypothetical protein